MVIAVNDGESVKAAQSVRSRVKRTMPLLVDSRRSVARSYGVAVWPTIVTLDGSHRVQRIQYGVATSVGAQRPSRGGRRR